MKKTLESVSSQISRATLTARLTERRLPAEDDRVDDGSSTGDLEGTLLRFLSRLELFLVF